MPQLPIQANGDNHEPMDLDVHDNETIDELPILDDVSLELESHVSHYHGLTRIQRLEFIADHCRSLKIDALNLAIDYIKEHTHNVKDYIRLFKKLQEAIEERDGRSCQQLDLAWIDTKKKKAGLTFEKLDADLKNFRTNSMKENIRRGQDDLGDHYLDCGEVEEAFTAYSKSRDFILTQRSQVNQCLNMIRASLLLRHWPAVSNNVIRAESNNTESAMNPTVSTKLHCAAGLFELNSRKYKKAAKHFLSTNFDHFNQPNVNLPNNSGIIRPANIVAGPSGRPGSPNPNFVLSFPHSHNDRDPPTVAGQMWDILAPINIAVYGSLCALATYTRQELANHLINSASFKQFSELEPQLREAVARFYDSKYAACWSILQDQKNVLLLDMYLAPHVERLYKMIRNKALIQYFEPYSAASMYKMAQAFDTSVVDLEREIITLIYDGHIKARIDSHNKILYAKNSQPRTLTFEKAINTGKLWQRRTRAIITRSVILNAGLIVTSSNGTETNNSQPDLTFDFKNCP